MLIIGSILALTGLSLAVLSVMLGNPRPAEPPPDIHLDEMFERLANDKDQVTT